jgi:LuxR family maltose regulon positive regulatory protein
LLLNLLFFTGLKLNLPILETKLFVPPLVHNRINRTGLVRQLNAGLLPGCKIILVCAPAGYGKTSLLSEWITSAKADADFAWLSLEPADNDPVRFFSYLAASLSIFLPGLSALLDDLFASPTLPAPQDMAAVLINPLNAHQGSLLIVLDDTHVIHNTDVHTALAYLVDNLPPHVHLALATRSDPPLPIHRFRARGQLVELRLNELRFNREEIRDLLWQTIKVELNDQELMLLESRSEGWVAGIRMLLLSALGNQNLKDILKNLSGQQRYIMDFLTEEALNNQDEASQAFLLETSVLERFCPALCDAISQKTNSQAMLDGLERTNCFLIPLDENRSWYRYHHLFADLLRVRVKQMEQNDPGLIKSIHERAGHWFDENQFYEEAVQQYILGSNYERAAEIVEERTIELFVLGRLHQLLAWIRLLPDDLAKRRPGLNIYQAWALAFASKAEEAEQHLRQAEAIIADDGLNESDQFRMQAEINAIRSLIAIISGNITAAIGLTGLPEDIVPKSSPFARGVHRWAVGYGLRILGDIEGAMRCFTEALEIGYELDNLFSIVTTAVDLGEMMRQKGELQKAEAIFRSALERALQSSSGPGYIGRLESFLANILVEQREFNEAGVLIEHAIEHNKQWENPNHTVYAWLINARYYVALQKYNQAGKAFDIAFQWTQKSPVVSSLKTSLDSMQVTLWLAMEENQKATNWLTKQNIEEILQKASINESDELIALAAAKVMIANEKKSSALELMTHIENAARQRNRITTLIQTLVLKSCSCSDPSQAVSILKEALELGLPRGFRQVFIEHGEWLLPTLENCQGISGVSDLLSVIYQRQAQTHGDMLLTKRELDILYWMAAGLSNAEIGNKLFISAGTVKAHSAAIYRKMDVANRAEAISKAKDLGLI